MKQEIKEWYPWMTVGDLHDHLNELINEGYEIVQVLPTPRNGNNFLIIVNPPAWPERTINPTGMALGFIKPPSQ